MTRSSQAALSRYRTEGSYRSCLDLLKTEYSRELEDRTGKGKI